MVYNVTLHPLARYPGPLLWRASCLPYTVKFARGKLPPYMVKLHNQYGPVVRVTPNELVFSSPNAWKDIYGSQGNMPPIPKWSSFYSKFGRCHSLVTEPDVERHKLLRRLFAPSFSKINLQVLEPKILTFVDFFIQRVAECSPEPVDLVYWLNSLTFDIIGDFAIGASFKSLENKSQHVWVQQTNDAAIVAPAVVLTAGHLGASTLLKPLLTLGQRVFEKHNASLRNSLYQRLENLADGPSLFSKAMDDCRKVSVPQSISLYWDL